MDGFYLSIIFSTAVRTDLKGTSLGLAFELGSVYTTGRLVPSVTSDSRVFDYFEAMATGTTMPDVV